MNITLVHILELIDEKGILKKDFCKGIGIGQSLLSEWLSGRNTSYLKYIVETSEFFNVSADYIIGKTPFSNGNIYNDLIFNYMLAPEEVQDLVDSLLGLKRTDKNIPLSTKMTDHINPEDEIEVMNLYNKLDGKGKTFVKAELYKQSDRMETNQ